MLRTGAPRSVFRSLKFANTRVARDAFHGDVHKVQWPQRSLRPQLVTGMMIARPVTATFVRRETNMSGNPYDKIDKKSEQKNAQKKLEPNPDLVSSTSSVHPVFGEIGVKETPPDPDMLLGVKHDLNTIKETFNLTDVPRQAYVIGLAGVLPYLATSLSTVFCAWEINNAATTTSFILSQRSAELLLEFLEPLQVGYGAVMLSFLGAIHWGLEWAGYGGFHGYRRYAIGVAAPAIAWPTILLPTSAALTTQFLAFVWLYYVDARSSRRGWTPPWYGTYRFVLTFIVGASIVVSLVGRGQIAGGDVKKLPSATERLAAFRHNAAQELALREEARIKAEGLDQTSESGTSEEGGENEKSEGDEDKKGGEQKDQKDQKEGKEEEQKGQKDQKDKKDQKEK